MSCELIAVGFGVMLAIAVVSEGEFIEAGEPIVVIRVDGNRIVVRRTRTPNAQE